MVSCARAARGALVWIVIAKGLIGCSEYIDRKETIAFSAGNAVQTNIVTHVTDPWPAHAKSKTFAVNGQRMQRAIENYRCGRVPGGSGTGGGAPSGEGASAQAQGGAGSC